MRATGLQAGPGLKRLIADSLRTPSARASASLAACSVSNQLPADFTCRRVPLSGGSGLLNRSVVIAPAASHLHLGKHFCQSLLEAFLGVADVGGADAAAAVCQQAVQSPGPDE